MLLAGLDIGSTGVKEPVRNTVDAVNRTAPGDGLSCPAQARHPMEYPWPICAP